MVDTVVLTDKSAPDVDSLFEKYTIKEIHEITQRTRAEIEKKKEDVRQMVGERYRDLIAAADTITEMKITIKQITNNIFSMEEQCSALQQYGISQSTKAEIEFSNKKQILDQYYAVAVQIKLLMDLPGKFWSFVESGKYLLAAELFLLANHLHSNLKTDALKMIPVTMWFPVVSRQCAVTSHFRSILMEACEQKLNNADVTAEELVQCLSSRLILGNISVQEIFEEFLVARHRCIKDLFDLYQQDKSIKDQVCQTIHVVKKTFQLIHEVFYEELNTNKESQCLLNQTLDAIDKTESPVCLMTYMGSPATKYIPQLIMDFRMTLPESPVIQSPEYLQRCCSNWIEQIIELVNKNVPSLLNYVTNIRGLAIVCDAVWEAVADNESTNSWFDVCDKLLQRPLLIWEEIFQALFLKQAETIIQSQLNHAFNCMMEQLKSFLQKEDKNNLLLSTEKDVMSFLWSENEGDLPSNVGWVSVSSRNPCDGGNLFMKSKGYTPSVQNICLSLNSNLKTLLEDLSSFQQNQNLEMNKEGAIRSFLIKTTASKGFEMIERSRVFVMAQQQSVKDDTTDSYDAYHITCVLILCRLWRALTELCPSLQQCLTHPSTQSSTTFVSKALPKLNREAKNENEDSTWLKLKSTLLEEANAMLRLWKTLIVSHFKEMCKNIKLWTPEEALLCIPQWDSIKIQEESESGQPVTSVIRVPSQVSILLHGLLLELCNIVNSVGSHTLPRTLLQELQSEVVNSVLSRYESLSFDQGVSQVMALQLLFDLQFVCIICGAKDNKVISSRIQNVSDALESCIDPFDLDVFMPYIQSNLRRCIQRSSVLLGPLISPGQIGILSVTSRTSLSSQQEQNNILTLNVAPPRFSILPIGSTSDTAKVSTSGMGKKETVKTNTVLVSTPRMDVASGTSDSAKSTATSFFGAVSWFGN